MSTKIQLQDYLSQYSGGYNNTGAIRWLWKNNPILWKNVLSNTSFLPETALPKQRCWHILNDIYSLMFEPDSTTLCRWQGSRYYKFTGQGTHMSNATVVANKKQKFIDEYGVDNPMKVDKFKNNLKDTCLERYGHTNYLCSTDGMTQVKAAWADPVKRKNRLDAIYSSYLERFGGYPYQNAEILEKAMTNAMKYREYVMPSGTIIKIQGYENKALDELLLTYQESDLITAKGKVPKISYYFNDKQRVYYPDIYIPKENKIIEVKSTYTYNMQLEKNLAKQKACIDQGFLFEFKIYSSTSTEPVR